MGKFTDKKIDVFSSLLFDGKPGKYPFALGYCFWVLSGSNSLEALKFFGDDYNDFSDDDVTLRGALGPRMKYWIGPDALQEAINVNQNIDSLEDYVKPIGIDQLEKVYNDFLDGLKYACMSFFDPSLDFDDTNNVPDLHKVGFINNDDQLDMCASFGMFDPVTFYNDVFLLKILMYIFTGFIHSNTGMLTLNIDCIDGSEIRTFYSGATIRHDVEVIEEPSEFWKEFENVCVFLNHLRSQLRKETFENENVAVGELIEKLVEKFIDKIECRLLKDLIASLILCVIIKNSGDNLRFYSDEINKIYNLVESDQLAKNLVLYAETLDFKLGVL